MNVLLVQEFQWDWKDIYYNIPEIPEIKKSPYKEAIKYSKDKWVITQMQGIRNTKFEEGKSTNYKRILMNAWNFISSKLDIKLDLYLSAELNRFNIPSIKEFYTPFNPKMSCLLMNYDYTAKRHKFKLNNVGLYEKN